MSGCLRAWETARGASGRTQKGIGEGAGLRTRTRAGPRAGPTCWPTCWAAWDTCRRHGTSLASEARRENSGPAAAPGWPRSAACLLSPGDSLCSLDRPLGRRQRQWGGGRRPGPLRRLLGCWLQWEQPGRGGPSCREAGDTGVARVTPVLRPSALDSSAGETDGTWGSRRRHRGQTGAYGGSRGGGSPRCSGRRRPGGAGGRAWPSLPQGSAAGQGHPRGLLCAPCTPSWGDAHTLPVPQKGPAGAGRGSDALALGRGDLSQPASP